LTLPLGLIAQAAGEGGTAVIVSIQIAAAQAAELLIGPCLSRLHLPYPLLEDI